MELVITTFLRVIRAEMILAPVIGRRMDGTLFSEATEAQRKPRSELSGQLCVFCLGLPEDRCIWIGVFPEREEILIGGARLSLVALQRVSAGQAETAERSDRPESDETPMVKNLLERGRRFVSLMRF